MSGLLRVLLVRRHSWRGILAPDPAQVLRSAYANKDPDAYLDARANRLANMDTDPFADVDANMDADGNKDAAAVVYPNMDADMDRHIKARAAAARAVANLKQAAELADAAADEFAVAAAYGDAVADTYADAVGDVGDIIRAAASGNADNLAAAFSNAALHNPTT